MTTVFFSLEKIYSFCYTKVIIIYAISNLKNKLLKGATRYVKNLSLVSGPSVILSSHAD